MQRLRNSPWGPRLHRSNLFQAFAVVLLIPFLRGGAFLKKRYHRRVCLTCCLVVCHTQFTSGWDWGQCRRSFASFILIQSDSRPPGHRVSYTWDNLFIVWSASCTSFLPCSKKVTEWWRSLGPEAASRDYISFWLALSAYSEYANRFLSAYSVYADKMLSAYTLYSL